MAVAIVGLGIAFSVFFIQWYMGKRADDEERKLKERARHRNKAHRSTKQ